MIKREIKTEEWSEVSEAFKRGNTQYYYLRVNPTVIDGYTVSIEDVYDHTPSDEDRIELYNRWLLLTKSVKIASLVSYTNSNSVKSYTIDREEGWEDSESRVSIRKAASDKKAAGRDSYTLTHGGVRFSISPDKVEEILSAVEVYASDCFDVTENKKSEISSFTTIDAVEEYDITSGYPKKLHFEL